MRVLDTRIHEPLYQADFLFGSAAMAIGTAVNRQAFEQDGRTWFRAALGDGDLAALDKACRLGAAPGARLGWRDGLLGLLGYTSRLTTLARTLLPRAIPVRIVIFNKSPDLNWQVPWHQDRVISVREKHDVASYDRWTKKAGIWHVEPPLDLLRGMIFARVHLDDTDTANGCLELALGTHARGRVDAQDAAAVAGASPCEVCEARRGDVLFVKALTLHRSKSSQQQSDRRTLRIDFCAESLPPPLAWAL
jgi:Phytanoyl-CoA dioxygenase (PhyH)